MSEAPQRRRDLGRILDDAFGAYRLHWRSLVGAALAIVAPVQIAVLGIGAGWLGGRYDGGRQVGATAASSLAQLLVVAPLVTAATIHILLRADRSRAAAAAPVPAPPIRQAWPGVVAALEVFRRMFWSVLLAVALTAIGTVPFVVPGLIFAVRSALVPQAVVLEGAGGAGALRRSWALVRGSWWWTFGALLTVEVIVSVASAAITVPLGYAASALDAQAVQLLGTIAAQALTLPLLALVTTLAYFALAAHPAPRVAPLGPAQPAPASPSAPPAEPPPPGVADAWERRRREGWEPPA